MTRSFPGAHPHEARQQLAAAHTKTMLRIEHPATGEPRLVGVVHDEAPPADELTDLVLETEIHVAELARVSPQAREVLIRALVTLGQLERRLVTVDEEFKPDTDYSRGASEAAHFVRTGHWPQEDRGQ